MTGNTDTSDLPRFETVYYTILNSVSSQSALVKSSIARKPEFLNPKIFEVVKTFKTFNPPDFKFYPSKLTDKKIPHMVLC